MTAGAAAGGGERARAQRRGRRRRRRQRVHAVGAVAARRVLQAAALVRQRLRARPAKQTRTEKEKPTNMRLSGGVEISGREGSLGEHAERAEGVDGQADQHHQQNCAKTENRRSRGAVEGERPSKNEALSTAHVSAAAPADEAIRASPPPKQGARKRTTSQAKAGCRRKTTGCCNTAQHDSQMTIQEMAL